MSSQQEALREELTLVRLKLRQAEQQRTEAIEEWQKRTAERDEARAEVARLTARLASAESERDRHRDREGEDGDRRSLRHLLVARPGPLLDAACDEIESLRVEVARLRAQLAEAPHTMQCANLITGTCTCWKAR